MSDRLLVGLAIAVACLWPSAALAVPVGTSPGGRGATRIDPIGVPIAVIRVRINTPGLYWVEVANRRPIPEVDLGFAPRPAVAVRDSAFMTASTLTSAETCLTGPGAVDPDRTCVAFRVRRAGDVWFWVYAVEPVLFGLGDLRLQRLGTARLFPIEERCPGSTVGISANCWVTSHRGFTFGGASIAPPGRFFDEMVHLETTVLPGSRASEGALPNYGHFITTLRGTAIETNRRHLGRLNGSPLSHRHGFGAEWIDLGGASGLGSPGVRILYGSMFGGGPVRLMRNDHVPRLLIRDGSGSIRTG